MAIIESGGTGVSRASGSCRFYLYHSNGILKLSDQAERYLYWIPSAYHLGPNIRILMTALSRALYKFELDVEDAEKQRYLATATWGLKYWEEFYGLPVKESSTDYEARRALVQAKATSFDNEDENSFFLGLQSLTGSDPVITLKNPRTNPYEVSVEIGVPYLLDSPDSEPTPTDNGTGLIAAGTYRYKVSFFNSSGETTPSDASTSVTIAANKSILLSSIPVGDTGTVGRYIYRKENAGSVYERVATISNNYSTTLVDNLASPGSEQPQLTTTARTPTGDLVAEYVAATKPAHLKVTVSSTGFRADINVAGDPV